MRKVLFVLACLALGCNYEREILKDGYAWVVPMDSPPINETPLFDLTGGKRLLISDFVSEGSLTRPR